MSHIDPTFDPTEVNYPEDDIVLGNNGEEVREPQDAPEPDPTEMARLYDCMMTLDFASAEQLDLIVRELDGSTRVALAIALRNFEPKN